MPKEEKETTDTPVPVQDVLDVDTAEVLPDASEGNSLTEVWVATWRGMYIGWHWDLDAVIVRVKRQAVVSGVRPNKITVGQLRGDSVEVGPGGLINRVRFIG